MAVCNFIVFDKLHNRGVCETWSFRESHFFSKESHSVFLQHSYNTCNYVNCSIVQEKNFHVHHGQCHLARLGNCQRNNFSKQNDPVYHIRLAVSEGRIISCHKLHDQGANSNVDCRRHNTRRRYSIAVEESA